MAKAKILIVDDEKPTRDVMARILSGTYECLTAPDADLALRAVADNPDLSLLVTDYKMPGKNGIELIKAAKEANPALACILITAFGEIELAVEAMKDGADDFLTKPITNLAQMEMRVAKAIEKNALVRKVEALQQQVDETRSLDFRHYAEKTLTEYLQGYQPEVVLVLRDDVSCLTLTGNGNLQ